MKDLTHKIGKRFGRLVVLSMSHRTKAGTTVWRVRCDCGTEKTIPNNNLGRTKSCGCWRREQFEQVAHPAGRRRQAERARADAAAVHDSGIKRCSGCSTDKPIGDFHRDRTNIDGLNNLCKRCHRDGRLRRTHHISLDAWEAMARAQNGKCASCEDELIGNHPAVDHDHATGAVRGLLCGPCNRALGLLRDSPDAIRGLLSYAEKYRQLEHAPLLRLVRRKDDK